MNKEKWIWMPHVGHYILGNKCRFHLNTYVGGYIVSTIGELWNERGVREIHAKIYDKTWYEENVGLKGESFDVAFFKRFGWEEIGMSRKYETMVFKSKRSKNKCCPFEQSSGADVDMHGYSDAEDAYKGHLKMCAKWAKINRKAK